MYSATDNQSPPPFPANHRIKFTGVKQAILPFHPFPDTCHTSPGLASTAFSTWQPGTASDTLRVTRVLNRHYSVGRAGHDIATNMGSHPFFVQVLACLTAIARPMYSATDNQSPPPFPANHRIKFTGVKQAIPPFHPFPDTCHTSPGLASTAFSTWQPGTASDTLRVTRVLNRHYSVGRAGHDIATNMGSHPFFVQVLACLTAIARPMYSATDNQSPPPFPANHHIKFTGVKQAILPFNPFPDTCHTSPGLASTAFSTWQPGTASDTLRVTRVLNRHYSVGRAGHDIATNMGSHPFFVQVLACLTAIARPMYSATDNQSPPPFPANHRIKFTGVKQAILPFHPFPDTCHTSPGLASTAFSTWQPGTASDTLRVTRVLNRHYSVGRAGHDIATNMGSHPFFVQVLACLTAIARPMYSATDNQSPPPFPANHRIKFTGVKQAILPFHPFPDTCHTSPGLASTAFSTWQPGTVSDTLRVTRVLNRHYSVGRAGHDIATNMGSHPFFVQVLACLTAIARPMYSATDNQSPPPFPANHRIKFTGVKQAILPFHPFPDTCHTSPATEKLLENSEPSNVIILG
ncbi:hypothetical protein MRX96_006074 [Rhipicephalus microplus]